MEKLEFGTGVKEFELKNGETIRFNPTDPMLITRIYAATEEIQKKQDKFDKQRAEAGGDEKKMAELFACMQEMESEMMDIINSLFRSDLTPAAFDYVGMYATDDGFPVWLNFLFAIIDKMDVAAGSAKEKQNPRIQAIMAKYKR